MIRSFSKMDLPQLLLIEKLTQISPWTEDIFQQCFRSNYICWVLELDNKIIGFVILTLQMGECHVLNLCIHPDYQRRGLGQQLLLYSLKTVKIKGAGIAYLEVRRSNLPAIALYEKMGFVQIGERPSYYATVKGREDAILYAKDLGVEDSW